MLSTGASDETKKMNIYDFAGNEWEWTLEYSNVASDDYCAVRGGSYYNSESNRPASFRYCSKTTFAFFDVGFRVTLYTNW